MTSIAITAEQRNLLYDRILIRLSGIDAVWLAAKDADFPRAERLGREFSDDLRLLLDGLGFGTGSGETVDLTTPRDVLRRIFTRILKRATDEDRLDAEEAVELQRRREENRLVRETCETMLLQLDGG